MPSVIMTARRIQCHLPVLYAKQDPGVMIAILACRIGLHYTGLILERDSDNLDLPIFKLKLQTLGRSSSAPQSVLQRFLPRYHDHMSPYERYSVLLIPSYESPPDSESRFKLRTPYWDVSPHNPTVLAWMTFYISIDAAPSYGLDRPWKLDLRSRYPLVGQLAVHLAGFSEGDALDTSGLYRTWDETKGWESEWPSGRVWMFTEKLALQEEWETFYVWIVMRLVEKPGEKNRDPPLEAAVEGEKREQGENKGQGEVGEEDSQEVQYEGPWSWWTSVIFEQSSLPPELPCSLGERPGDSTFSLMEDWEGCCHTFEEDLRGVRVSFRARDSDDKHFEVDVEPYGPIYQSVESSGETTPADDM